MTRRALVCLLATCLQSSAWDVGFDFRATAGAVTDPSYATYVLGVATPYPTNLTLNGQPITFGWESGGSSVIVRDAGGIEPRLGGINCAVNNGVGLVFRVDLPSAGTYAVALALGDGVRNNTQTNHVVVSSSDVPLLTVDLVSPSNRFVDAAGNIWSPTAWGASNVSVQRAFAGSILRLKIGATVDAPNTCVAHLRVTSVQPAGSSPAAVLKSYFIE